MEGWAEWHDLFYQIILKFEFMIYILNIFKFEWIYKDDLWNYAAGILLPIQLLTFCQLSSCAMPSIGCYHDS